MREQRQSNGAKNINSKVAAVVVPVNVSGEDIFLNSRLAWFCAAVVVAKENFGLKLSLSLCEL